MMKPEEQEDRASERLRSAHPVEPAVRAQVLSELQRIEAAHDVTVLFACESGSRGWGFASPDSDYDVRFLYVHRLPWYLTVLPQRDVIEVPISGDLDVNGWELRKALGLMRESNPTLFEWLRSPIVYREEAETMSTFAALAQATFSRVRAWHHYRSMAKKNFREHLQAEVVRFKKYLYVLRPLLAARWVAQQAEGVPPMRFAALAQDTLDPVRDAALLAELDALLEVKMRAGEAATSPRWPQVHAFIEAELGANPAAPDACAPMAGMQALEAFLFETVRRCDALAGGRAGAGAGADTSSEEEPA